MISVDLHEEVDIVTDTMIAAAVSEATEVMITEVDVATKMMIVEVMAVAVVVKEMTAMVREI